MGDWPLGVPARCCTASRAEPRIGEVAESVLRIYLPPARLADISARVVREATKS